MRAIIQRAYGEPDVLELKEVPPPRMGRAEILVQVRAASINAADLMRLAGKPYLVRPMFGLLRPKHAIAGAAMAGQVEAVGAHVADFAPGDAVYGEIDGAFAEYASVRPHRVARMPRALTFEEAAAIPVAGVTALQGLRDEGQVRAGHQVLINGASGGVGSLAVQIAKALGGTVTGVSSRSKTDLVRSLGATYVIDYEREDFTRGERRYDVILDLAGDRSLEDCLRVMGPDGVFVSSVGRAGGKWLGVAPRLIGLRLAARGHSQTVRVLAAHQTRSDLEYLAAMAESGQLMPVIDRTYPLAEAADALRHFATGGVRGKLALAV
jgi:NADPH:quinone reductase-like Zn-dependent oxidoreductase